MQQFVIDQAQGITSDTSSSGSSLSGGVIAGLAVVGAILLAIIVIVMGGFIAQRRARRGMITDKILPKGGGVGIKWSGVGYEVKSLDRQVWSRIVAWMKGSGSRLAPNSTENGDVIGPNGGKVVLRESCGQLPPGGFCCILGPSGAGKSTLVDILAGKRKAGRVEGSVRYVRDGNAKVGMGYVDQVG